MTWFREWLRGEGDTGSALGVEEPARGASPAGGTTRPRSRAATGPESPAPESSYPGERYGLPEDGPGSVVTLARRGAQFVLDALLAGLVASLFTYPALPQNWSLVSWAVLMLVPVAAFGVTPAMAMLGMRVVRLDRSETPSIGLLWALVRTASVFFVVPALIVDRDGRGVQDRASRTIVLRSR